MAVKQPGRAGKKRPQPQGTPKGEVKRARQREAEERSRRRRVRLTIVVMLLIPIAGIVYSLWGGRTVTDHGDTPAPSEVRSYDVASKNHVRGDVTYAQTPPVGGDHAPVWQNCGFYSEPILPQLGVHSLEHGAVWITYATDLPTDQVAVLRRLAQEPYVLVSRWFDGLPGPVVASAWGRQLVLPAASDPALNQFVRRFAQSPEAPEPGAPCTGGQGG